MAWHASAALMLGLGIGTLFFVHHDYYIFLEMCIVPLFFLYSSEILGFKSSEEEMDDARKVLILFSWSWLLWQMDWLLGTSVMLTLSTAVLFIVSIGFGIFYYRRHGKHFRHREMNARELEIMRKWKRHALIVVSFSIVVIMAGFIVPPLYWYVEGVLEVWTILLLGSIFSLIFLIRKRNQLSYRVEEFS